MSHEPRRHDLTKRRVVYEVAGMERVTVRHDLEYRATDGDVLTMDVYYPSDSNRAAPRPAVVFVIGYSDAGAQSMLGCRFKEMESFISWGRLAAVSGLIGITYTTGRDPAADIRGLLQYLEENASSLGIDDQRIGVWACSGHVPNALWLLTEKAGGCSLKCAVLCYGFMLDLGASAIVAEASKVFRFVNPGAGRSIEHLQPTTPLLIVRAGQDEFPRLNETIDRFVAGGLVGNLPMTVVNHPTAQHAFDLTHDSEVSREIIRQVLAFLRFHLSA